MAMKNTVSKVALLQCESYDSGMVREKSMKA
jgi:hypothetical protein